MKPALIIVMLALFAVPRLGAQSTAAGRAGPRSVLPEAEEVALARSAAPRDVSGAATVLVWNGRDFDEAVAGSNGVTCYVARSFPESLEPHCFDEEGSRTVLPVHLLIMKRRHEGRSEEEIDREVAEGLRDGTFRLPARPVMSYMMSAAQDLYDDDGRHVGPWNPHLMIYYPYLTSEDAGLGPVPSTEAAVVVDPGTPFSNFMVVVKDFVEPDSGGGATRDG